MFAKVFVINLPFKTDRLAVFQANVPECLGNVTVWPAVHGDTVRHPEWWTAGPGAWGCYRSHMQVLEYCYQNNLESYLVLEDDAIFRPDFHDMLTAFMSSLPSDWEQIYLGGQLYHEVQQPPRKFNDLVYIPSNVNRTHCFAVHRRGYEKLYRFLHQVPFANQEHIDHHLGRLHESGKLKVYCPARWLVGQDGGPSNISGNTNGATFWVDPEKCAIEPRRSQKKPVVPVFLESTIDVAVNLERRGWHRGKWQNSERLDRGVCNSIASLDVKAGLVRWFNDVMPEAVREGNPCICLFHPSLNWACVESLPCAKFHRIVADSVDEAERQLALIQEGLESTTPTQIRRRNLIYHIWPRSGNGVWQWNVAELLKRIDQFDGTRSIGIATSADADSVETVRAAFSGVRIDNWLIAENDPQLGEVVTFPKLLHTVPADNSVTFYGHAKGVKYDNPNETREWASMCYEVCLDDPVYVDASLDLHPVAGPFINTQPWAEARNGWHFAGAFYWFNNSAVFSKPNWSDVLQIYWGAELWPGNLFTRAEAGALFGQECGRLYDPQELARMRSWMEEWRSNKRKSDVRQPTISVVIPTLGRSSLADTLACLLPQLSTEDEIIVVADGDEAYQRADSVQKQIPLIARLQLCMSADARSCYGNAQRNHGIDLAKGDLLWFCDDDDIPLSVTLRTIRERANRVSPTMFRMDHAGQTIWTQREIKPGNVSAQMLVVPNRKDLPRFPVPASNPPLSDYEWVRAVADQFEIHWDESVIYRIDRHNRGKLAS